MRVHWARVDSVKGQKGRGTGRPAFLTFIGHEGGSTEIAEVENAGVAKGRRKRRGGKCRSRKYRMPNCIVSK